MVKKGNVKYWSHLTHQRSKLFKKFGSEMWLPVQCGFTSKLIDYPRIQRSSLVADDSLAASLSQSIEKIYLLFF